MNYYIRKMIKEDIPEIVELEKLSFPTPWSAYAFNCELEDNQYAYYNVCLAKEEEKILGYAGMWKILDEVHITNVAVHPSYRGLKLGELIMRTMMGQAIALGADKMTLEVRKSNIVAQRLYEKLGFMSVGFRKGYYSDNNEDAVIMWCDLLFKEGAEKNE